MNDRNRLRTLGPSPASSPPPSLLFLLRISTLARVVYLSRRRCAALRARTQKHNFIPSPVAPLSLSLSAHLSRPSQPPLPPARPPLLKFYIVSIVVVTSRRFDYAARARCFLPRILPRAARTQPPPPPLLPFSPLSSRALNCGAFEGKINDRCFSFSRRVKSRRFGQTARRICSSIIARVSGAARCGKPRSRARANVRRR